jgi:predicted nucleic acid-binding protein
VIVLDTSGLLAALDADQRHHGPALQVLAADDGPFLLSPFVLAELEYLLMERVGPEAEQALLHEVAGGAYDLVPFGVAEVAARPSWPGATASCGSAWPTRRSW